MASTDERSNPLLVNNTGPGTEISDFLPIPATDATTTARPQKPQAAEGVEGGNTFSHELATHKNPDLLQGIAQQDHGDSEIEDVVDLGWNEKKENIPGPLIGGMDNEELWLLVRRFNRVGPASISP